MSNSKPQLKRNAAGFFAGGLWHPIRGGDGYDPALAGDYDFPNERAERKEANKKKAWENWMRQEENRVRADMADASGEKRSLLKFVRAAGGIRPSYSSGSGKSYDAGELNRLTYRQCGKRGIVGDNAKKTLEKMYENALEAGFDLSSHDELIEALEREAKGKGATFATGGNQLETHWNPAKRKKSNQPSFDFSEMPPTNRLFEYPYFLTPETIEARKSDLMYLGVENGDKQYRSRSTGRRYSTRENPKKPMATAAQRKAAAAALAKAMPGATIAQGIEVLKKLSGDAGKPTGRKPTARRKKNPVAANAPVLVAIETGEVGEVLTQTSAGDYLIQFENRIDIHPASDLTVIETPETVENGMFSRFVARHKAGRAVKKSLRLKSAASRAAKRSDELTRAALEENPATVRKVGGYYQIQLPNRKFLRDGSGRIWKTRAIKQAREVAAKTKIDAQSELEWLRSLHRKQNPIDALSMFANGAVGLASAFQIHDRIARKKPVKKRAAKKVPAQKNPAKTATATNAKTNPATKIPRRKVFEMFQGRPATSVKEMPVSHHAPKTLDELGRLIEIKFADGRVHNFENRVKNPLSLCSSPRGKRLWIAGARMARQNPKLEAHQIELVAPIDYAVYETFKPHIEGDEVIRHYIHALGEETGDMPMFGVDNQGFAVIHGGAYSIEDRGIVN